MSLKLCGRALRIRRSLVHWIPVPRSHHEDRVDSDVVGSSSGLVSLIFIGGCDGDLLCGFVGCHIDGLAASKAAVEDPDDDYDGEDTANATADASDVAFGVVMLGGGVGLLGGYDLLVEKCTR